MKLTSLKDLKDVIALCRKTGVKSIEIDGVKLELNEHLPVKSHKPGTDAGVDQIESDSPTEEQMMFWSTQDIPTPTEN